MITVTLEDNMQLMARYPDKHFDLAIVDPQYGINSTKMQMGSNPKRSRNDGHGSGPAVSTAVKLKKGRLNQGSGKLKNRILNTSDIDWDNEIPKPEYFQELFRVSKNQIIWGGNYFPLPPSRCIICWDKMQPWENFSQWEMAWTSFDMPASILRYSNTGGANKEEKIHPTQKPVALYKWLLNKYALGGATILDTHYGSGSIGIACHDYGHDLVACEISPKYFDDAMVRLERHQAQLNLFELAV